MVLVPIQEIQKKYNVKKEVKKNMSKSYQTIVMKMILKENLFKVINQLKEKTNSEKFLVLKGVDNEEYQDFFFVIYESMEIFDDRKYTVMHKKGRCLYTINALNELIKKINHGNLDKEFIIDWEEYQNKILFIGREKQLVEMETQVHKLIKNKKG